MSVSSKSSRTSVKVYNQVEAQYAVNIAMLKSAVLQCCADNSHDQSNDALNNSKYTTLKAMDYMYGGGNILTYRCSSYMNAMMLAATRRRVVQSTEQLPFSEYIRDVVIENMNVNSPDFIQFLHIVMHVLDYKYNDTRLCKDIYCYLSNN